ncbi:hypothetical protein L9F63_013523, partial [Diploptera punctata]
MCRNARVRSPVGISPLNGVARSSPLDPIGRKISYSPNVVTLSEQRIHYIPFAFNLMNILPKCQQAELLYSMLIQDLSSVGTPDSLSLADAPNKLLSELLYEQLKQIHDKELHLTVEDCMGFLQLLHSRERQGTSYSLPIPQPRKCSAAKKTEEMEMQQTHSYANSVASEATMCDKIPQGAVSIPKWRCFLKGVSATHIVLTFVPASYSDLKLLMLAGHSVEERTGQLEVSNDIPFRMRASSLDTETKKASHGLNRIHNEDSKFFIDKFSCGPSQKVPPNPSPDVKLENAVRHVPKYGAVTLPIYVYDCPLAILIDVLVYGESDGEYGNKMCKDIYQDRTFKSHSLFDFIPNIKQSKHTSPEPKSEDSDGVPDVPIFKSLHLNHTVHALDVEAAVDECEEALIEIDITNFMQTVCGHLKDFCMKARVDELKHINTHAPCQQLELLHKQIKKKFIQILTVMFRPVPSHPEYYFCTPNWEKSQMGEQVHLNEDEVHDQKVSEVEDDMDNMTFHSEMVEFRSDHGSAIGIMGMGTGAMWEGQGGLLTPDDARTSLLSNMDSDSVSDLPDEEATEEVSPLFLHLTCTVRSKGKITSCSVRVLPTCLGELVQSLKPEETELDLKELQVTLDILCLTLSDEIESDVSVKEKLKPPIKSSPLFSPSVLRGEECETIEGDDRDAVRPCGSIGSEGFSCSPDPHLAEDRLQHLPEYQLKAITSSVEKIEWLMRDEIAAFLLDSFPLDKNTLSFVANHVASSPDHPSCLMERVPLQFVFGPEQSLERFCRKYQYEDFRNLSINGYHLCQEDHLYYLVRDKHPSSVSASVSVSASDPANEAVNQKKSHTGDQAELWSTTAASSEFDLEVDTDTDDDFRDQDHRRIYPKLKLDTSGMSITHHDSVLLANTSMECGMRSILDSDGKSSGWSEVSSIVESALGTEDGYEGDSSDSADDCDWLQDLDMRRPSLPNFWLIMKVDNDAVTTYFHCRFFIMARKEKQEAPYQNVQRNVLAMIKQLCKVVNQTMLLQNLHDTRMCDQLLEPETDEDIWKSISGAYLHLQGSYLEATLKFMPGWFACNVVWETHFILHPRLKTGPGKAGFSRGVQALRMVLNRFSVSNRKNMFVYRDNSENVFYLRLHENVRSQNKSTPPGGLGRSDTEDNLPGPVSRSSSIASLTRKNTSGIPVPSSGVTEESLNQSDTRPRLESFGEKELSTQQHISATDTVVLKVHGISEAVKEDLVQVLQNRLDDAVLEVLSLMLARNPMCKLTPDDVHFIQKPFKTPESVIQFSIQSHTLPHLQALAYYLRQNLLQFLYTPKYTDSRIESHFQDYSQPELSTKRVAESDLFLYNQSPSSGSKGIACIAMAVVDSEGNLVQHEHYPKPSCSAHLEALYQSEFETLTFTNSYEPESGLSRGPGPVALLEFRIWKQGRVNIESLTQKLRASVRHATWDLLTEYRLLTAPLCVPSSMVSQSPPPFSTNSTSSTMLLSTANSEPSTPLKAKKSVRTSDPTPLERNSNLYLIISLKNTLQSIASTKSCKMDSYESGETGILHEMYHVIMKPWLEFGVDLAVPAVRKHSVILTVRHPLAVMIRELQSLINLNANDTTPLAFWGCPISEEKDEVEYVPGPFMGPNFNFGTSPTVNVIGETTSCLLIARNLNQWKACVSEDGVFEPDVLDPKNAQKVFQKFSPLLHTSEQVPKFVPRQRFLLAVLSTQKIIIYTYNWSKERVENLHQQLSQLGHWLSARSSLLTSIVTQKMGLFHNQELTRKQHGRRKVTNPYLSNLGDVEQLVKFPVGVNTSHKDQSNRRVGFSTQLGSALAWRDIFRDGKPRRPISKTPTNTDSVVCHVQQMLETRHFDRK